MTLRTMHLTLLVFTCIPALLPNAHAQDSSLESSSSLTLAATQPADLPDAPTPAAAPNDAPSDAPPPPQAPAARTHRSGVFDALIDPTEIAPHLTAFDKVGMGLKRSVSPFAIIGWVGSATYGEAFNRSPNYGQNGKDYLQRIGASAARASSETIFTTSVLAPILHEDPRYYVLGPGHSGFRRTTHAISQIFTTPTDKGGTSINYALLGGNLAGSALTQAYYPSVNRGVSEVMTTFGTSLAGSAVAYILDEFFYNVAHIAQLRQRLP